MKFNKIIFNFPHVGGKMKIHLNRKLLKEFFASASDVLSDGGSVIVALCNGQGGTAADSKPRRWDDTWQVLEMAAHSDFVLVDSEQFDISCFPNYTSVGYRSRDISFHNHGGIVHVFKKRNPLNILLEDQDKCFQLELVESPLTLVHCSKLHASKLLANPFSKASSVQSYLYKSLQKELGADIYYHKETIITAPVLEMMDGIITYPYHKQLAQYIPIMYDMLDMKCRRAIPGGESVHVVKHLLCNSLSSNFSVPPVTCQVVVFGLDDAGITLRYVNDLIRTHNMNNHCKSIYNDNSNEMSIVVEYDSTIFTVVEAQVLDDCICYVIHIDILAQVLFQLDGWRPLWMGELDNSVPPIYCQASLYPRTFIFDIGFSVCSLIKDNHVEEKLFSVLWHTAGDIIIDAKLLSVYLPPNQNLVCYCYRITYRSYTGALYRKRTINIHENVIGKIIEKVMKVNLS